MINIAELLEDVPEGMILYSPLFGEVKFKYINGSKFGIVVAASDGCCRSFDKYGRYFTLYNNAECLLFPSKDCRTWEGWKMPAKPNFKVGDWITDGTCKVKITDINNTNYWYSKNCILGEIESIDKKYHLWTIQDAKDGDILISENGNPFIFCEDGGYDDDYDIFAYGGLNEMGEFYESYRKISWTYRTSLKPATKEQCDFLFAKMKEAGYQWDVDKKELCKIQPHYDIANFHAGMPVLVRDYNNSQWSYVQFSHLIAERNVGEGGFKFNACGIPYIQCIPFNEETKHLLGTSDMPREEYINW